jgi:hypothetical protein
MSTSLPAIAVSLGGLSHRSSAQALTFAFIAPLSSNNDSSHDQFRYTVCITDDSISMSSFPVPRKRVSQRSIRTITKGKEEETRCLEFMRGFFGGALGGNRPILVPVRQPDVLPDAALALPFTYPFRIQAWQSAIPHSATRPRTLGNPTLSPHTNTHRAEYKRIRERRMYSTTISNNLKRSSLYQRCQSEIKRSQEQTDTKTMSASMIAVLCSAVPCGGTVWIAPARAWLVCLHGIPTPPTP